VRAAASTLSPPARKAFSTAVVNHSFMCASALCCEPIGEDYLWDITTRLAYCDHQCYVSHRHVAGAALEQRARCEQERYAFARNEFYSADPELSFA
jgi:hypothetical protein